MTDRLRAPKQLAAALAGNPAAKARYDALSASHQREYVKWIAEAKTDATRERRAAKAIERLLAAKR